MLLENSVAVIHGGGGSIGAAAARAFAREGARLFLAGRSRPRLEAAAAAAREEGAEVDVAVVDAMDQASVDRHLDRVAEAAGRIDIALNAVGFDHVQGLPIAETSLDDYLHPIVGYLRTNFVTAKAAARHMVARRSGVILTISTPGARLTGRGLIGNAAQSAGLEGFSRALAGELGGGREPHGRRDRRLSGAPAPTTAARCSTTRRGPRFASANRRPTGRPAAATAAGGRSRPAPTSPRAAARCRRRARR